MADAAAKDGRWNDAVGALQRAAALNPGEAMIVRNLGSILSSIGRAEEAAAAFQTVVSLEPEDVQSKLTYAQLLIDTGRKDDAGVEVEEASRLALRRVLQQNDEQQGNDEAEAELLLERIVGLREVGFLLERLNKVQDLRKLLVAAEKANVPPEALGLLWASLALREGRLEDAKRLLLRGCDKAGAPHWHRLMIKVADALGDADEAFAAAEAMHRASLDYDGWKQRAAAYRANIRLTAEVVTPDWAARIKHLPADDDLPDLAFVVGFPRSGTTLLDTFLMGHPRTHVIEEGRMLESATRVVSEASGADWPIDLVERARKVYLDELSRNVPVGFKGLIVDKHPMNMLRLAVLHALFPSAKVIFVQRHPCDVVLSGFMQSFRLNHAMACFLDLHDAADLYDAAMTMWTRSRDAVSQEVHSVVYERLTADAASELKPALDFLGLGWCDELLDHETTAKSRGLITTASYDQVVQPLSRAPSGRWRRYREQMEGVLPTLLPWAKHLGYTD